MINNLKEIYEAGVILRGFTLVNYIIRNVSVKTKKEVHKDLRSSFISAITQFVEKAFQGSTLEYLESGDILFIFITETIQAGDFNTVENILAYAICDKKKNIDKQVEKVREKLKLMLIHFKQKYNNENFTIIDKFQDFKPEIEKFFTKNNMLFQKSINNSIY